MSFEILISDVAANTLTRLPTGLSSRIRNRVQAIAKQVTTAHWSQALNGLRGARTLESIVDGFALKYRIDPLRRCVCVESVEDRRFETTGSTIRLGA